MAFAVGYGLLRLYWAAGGRWGYTACDRTEVSSAAEIASGHGADRVVALPRPCSTRGNAERDAQHPQQMRNAEPDDHRRRSRRVRPSDPTTAQGGVRRPGMRTARSAGS
ncbi:hypothetical protein N599_15445 [Saccharopolyspora erythraea D]|nr:hypothetical protein N599_15445 [Saccharopolyspora erythraea D]